MDWYNRGDRRLLRVVAATEASAAIICGLVIIASTIRHRPVPSPIFDIPMVLLLLVGGVCAALVVSDRWRSRAHLGFRWLIFGDLRRAIATGLVIVGLS